MSKLSGESCSVLSHNRLGLQYVAVTRGTGSRATNKASDWLSTLKQLSKLCSVKLLFTIEWNQYKLCSQCFDVFNLNQIHKLRITTNKNAALAAATSEQFKSVQRSKESVAKQPATCERFTARASNEKYDLLLDRQTNPLIKQAIE